MRLFPGKGLGDRRSSRRIAARVAGFTLLEMSVVLAIIALIAAGAMVTFTAYIQTSQYNATVAEMDTIEQAIKNFSAANGRIPCPSSLTTLASDTGGNYGAEAGSPGACAGANFSADGVAEGGVPTRALKLPDSYMYDAWGRRLRYAAVVSSTASGTVPAPNGACSAGVTVNDASGAARSTQAIYAIISHGANGHGAYTSNGVAVNAGSTNTNEQTNCHCDATGVSQGYPYTPTGVATINTPTYVQMLPSVSSASVTNSYDDIVTYKESWQLATANSPLQAAAGCTYIYVTNSTSDTVTAINASTNAVAATITIGTSPESIAISGGYAYVVSVASPTVSVISTSTNTVTSTITLPFGALASRNAIAIAGGYAYVLITGSEVAVINLSTNTVTTTITVGTSPNTIAAYNGYVYTLNTPTPNRTMSVINASSNTVVATVILNTNGSQPVAIAFSGTSAYVLDNGGQELQVVDLGSNTVTSSITGLVSGTNSNLAISGGYAYAAGFGSSNLNVVNLGTNTASTVPFAGGFAYCMGLYGGYVYVGNNSDIYVISTSSDTITNTIAVGCGVIGAIVFYNGNAYAPNSNTITVINTSTDTVTATPAVGVGQHVIAIPSSR